MSAQTESDLREDGYREGAPHPAAVKRAMDAQLAPASEPDTAGDEARDARAVGGDLDSERRATTDDSAAERERYFGGRL